MSLPEVLLWQMLRRKQFVGFRFRRQVSLGDYFVDFACFDPKLILEVDGSTHDGAVAVAYDMRRSNWLEVQGFIVLRIPATEVLKNMGGVVEGLAIVLADLQWR